jgi:hypothetical protein
MSGKDGGAGLRLELGKCYRDADGDVYGPMEATRKPSPYRKTHPFWDPKNGVSFTEDGHYYSAAKPNEIDLVAEVVVTDVASTDAAGVPEPKAEGSPSPSPEELIKELAEALETACTFFPCRCDFDGDGRYRGCDPCGFEMEVKELIAKAKAGRA